MEKDLKIKLGLRLKELRILNNLTQEKLAEKMSMERTNLARIETGKQFPNAENLVKFAQVFNISINKLFEFEHLKEKQELIKEINSMLGNLEIGKLRYIYKLTMGIKNIK